MASLTPLSKGLIALAVIGGMASAVWHLGLKDRLGGDGASLAVSKPADMSVQKPAPSTIAPPTEAPRASAAPESPVVVPQATVPVAPPPSLPKVENKASESRLSVPENAETGRKLLAAGNFAQARVHLELAAQGGDGGAACRLGEMTLKGQGGIPASQEKAATLFQLAQSRNVICFASGQ